MQKSRLQSGKLSLSSACQLQAFFEKQAKKIKTEKSKQGIEPTNQIAGSKQELPNQGVKKETQDTQKATEEILKTGNKSTDGVLKISRENTIVHPDFCIKDQTENNPSLSLSVEEKQKLVKKAEGCSTRATMKLLSEVDPSLSISKEQTRFLGNGKVEIKFVIDESCHKKLEELKSLLSHKNPVLSHRELLSILLEEALKKHDPRRKKVRKISVRKEIVTSAQKLEGKNINNKQSHKNKTKQPVVTSASGLEETYLSTKVWTRKSKKIIQPTSSQKGEYKGTVKKLSRAIPTHLKKYIWERDGGQCTYVHSKTKRKCSSKHLLQIDHIRPFSLSGKSEASNLRLLCAGHNQFRSEKTFGRRISYTTLV